jgi:ADP-ribose pyrophosphatase YjhB (NUDIX family)
MDMNFCRRCGTRLTHVKAHIYKCEQGHPIYANSSPGVGIFLINEQDEVILSVRAIDPKKGMLDVMGGLIDGEETAEDAAKRELMEELSLKEGEYGPLTFLSTSVVPYDYKGEMVPILAIFFYARLKTSRELSPSDDVAEIYTASLNNVDEDSFFSDGIRAGFKKLKSTFSKAL